eukprot:TRINITY_DN6388_c0_g1_i1.p1 TRINITY_DN6388_c0_g1~~TRINITY_DN6388_c0_g1_i1.p1  ORF type:complete len:481 (-),score=126.46 TRINITY_DN6388_c0_g1_i1:60-1502(-)
MSKDDEICDYLRKNEVHKVLETLTAQLLHSKPAEPIGFMAERLTKLKHGTITAVKAREILDSRGLPTVEVDVVTGNGVYRAAVPSGASTGVHEAVELRDGDPARFLGKGVQKAVQNVLNNTAPELVGKLPTDQAGLDGLLARLDGTSNKARLGANATLACSIAVARAAADIEGVPLYEYVAQLAGNASLVLPVPCFNVINGGKHAGNALAIQEYMVAPTGAATFTEAMQMGCEVYQALKGLLKKKFGLGSANVGDEGGFAPPVKAPTEPLELLKGAIEHAGLTGRVKICIDCAASEFYKDRQYDLAFKSSSADIVSAKDLSGVYVDWMKRYPVVSIEDPFDQDDFGSWTQLTSTAKARGVQIVGDDLTVTNVERIRRAIETKACNSLLLKVNQIGTLTEAISAARLARDHGWGVMVSHRSGETEDTFIADLAVGLGCGQLKSGAPCRGERTAKYNELLRIEEELNRCQKPFAFGFAPWKV